MAITTTGRFDGNQQGRAARADRRAPGAKNVLDGLNTLKERVDDLQKRMRGLDD
jgi:hypothetical protein